MNIRTKWIFWVGLIACGPTASAASVTRGPYLQSAGPDRITVCWRTDEPTTSVVTTGADAAATGSPVTVPGTRINHAVTLTGLNAGTRYFYRVMGTPVAETPAVDVGGPEHWFRTSPPPHSGEPLRMWVIGDSGSHPGYAPYAQFYAPSVALYQAYRNATAAAGKTTDLWMMLGDNAYNLGSDAEYQAGVFNKYPELLRNSVLWSAIGNHDIAGAGFPYTATVPYETIFHFPTAGECGGLPSGSERYYSFDRGNVHFICLDSTTPANVNSTVGAGGMMDWLIADLKATTAPWIIVCFHDTPYSRGSHPSDTEANMKSMRERYGPVFENFGVDLVLAGHSHVYERSGLMTGHYGTSATWNPSMRLQPGNGSELGGVAANGQFLAGQAYAQGAYQKPMATSQAGTVYAVVGSSGSLSNWNNISPALVNPDPHPAHLVSLRLMGGLSVDIHGERLTGQYLDQNGAVRDDFTLIKGSTYTLHGAMPAIDGERLGVAFPVTRSGAIRHAEVVAVSVNVISGVGVAPEEAAVAFAANQSSALVRVFPPTEGAASRFEASLLPTTLVVQPGATPRAAYRLASSPQPGEFAPTPAATWYASRFGGVPSDTTVWQTDDDGDGLSLLLEYALGGEPGRNDSGLLPRAEVDGGSFLYRYVRPQGRTDVSYQVLGSESLEAWSADGISDGNDGPATALGEPRKVELPIGQGVTFIRLRTTLTP